jgi:hypothetical protein
VSGEACCPGKSIGICLVFVAFIASYEDEILSVPVYARGSLRYASLLMLA